MNGEAVGFWICAIVAVFGAFGMLFSRKAVHSALFIASTMVSLAVLYVLLSAPFLGVVQIIVYTGAVMMLFLFVLMIVGVDASDSLVETLRGQRAWAIVLGLGFGILLISGIGQAVTAPAAGVEAADAAYGGNVQGLAALLFGKYVLAFEATSALLITAALGAMVLAHRERLRAKPSQRELSIARFREARHPGTLPPPGVYARHNAVDTPALLPDGSASELSVPGPLRSRGGVRSVDRAAIAESAAIAAGKATLGAPEDIRDDELGKEQS